MLSSPLLNNRGSIHLHQTKAKLKAETDKKTGKVNIKKKLIMYVCLQRHFHCLPVTNTKKERRHCGRLLPTNMKHSNAKTICRTAMSRKHVGSSFKKTNSSTYGEPLVSGLYPRVPYTITKSHFVMLPNFHAAWNTPLDLPQLQTQGGERGKERHICCYCPTFNAAAAATVQRSYASIQPTRLHGNRQISSKASGTAAVKPEITAKPVTTNVETLSQRSALRRFWPTLGSRPSLCGSWMHFRN